jgi:glutathione S-transferase
MITISAFKWVPPFAQGLVRDLRVRWALNEAAAPYRTRLIDAGEQGSAGYRALQPFGQVPAFEEDGLVLFESGAIVLHIGARSAALLPGDEPARARAITWLFAALNTIEVVVQPLAEIDLFYAGQEWAQRRRPDLEKRVRLRLSELAARLGNRQYLGALHGRRPDDDHGAQNPAPYQTGGSRAAARGIPGALRGPARVSARAAGTDGGVRGTGRRRALAR